MPTSRSKNGKPRLQRRDEVRRDDAAAALREQGCELARVVGFVRRGDDRLVRHESKGTS